MSKRNSSRPKLLHVARRRPAIVIALAVVLSMFAASAMLAAFSVPFKQKVAKKGTVSTASMNPNSPSKEYVFAGGRLVATEEPVASGCGSPPPSPGNTLVAAAQSTTSVLLGWATSSGADHYEVQRKQNITSAWSSLTPNPTTNSFTDSSVLPGVTYLYQVRAVDSAGACPSAYSNVDLATTIIFIDDPLQSQVTIIKTLHVTQLRQAVDAVRAAANLGAAAWTMPLDQVRAIHFTELRTKLNDALPSLGFSQIPADSGIAFGNTIYTTHLQAVRAAVK